jgi:hypothetical protein
MQLRQTETERRRHRDTETEKETERQRERRRQRDGELHSLLRGQLDTGPELVSVRQGPIRHNWMSSYDE